MFINYNIGGVLMKSFIDYIETSCAKLPDNHVTYLYKKQILDEMTDRANEVTHSGLKDEKVIADLMADEYPNLEGNYKAWAKAYRKKKLAKTMRLVMGVGGVLFFILMFITYFEVSKATGDWKRSWLIIVGGIFAMIIFYTSFGIKRICKMRRIFHPIARLLIAGCVILFTVFMFLFWLMMVPELIVWPILMVGIILAFITDIIFAFATKQKFRTVTAMVYMPLIFTMLYIILSAYNVIGWFTGWPVILLGLVVDLVAILLIALGNAKYFMYKKEDEE